MSAPRDQPLPRLAKDDDANVGSESSHDAIVAAGFELQRLIGRGAMGSVYQAFDPATDRVVAIKFLDQVDAANEIAIARFRREFELASKLDHPHIARVYDARFDTDRPHCVMEFVEGQPIDHHIRANRFTLSQAMVLFIDVCRTVQYAHDQGVVHRDLKPDHIIIRPDGRPCIVDFGLGLSAGDQPASECDRLSIEGHVVGSPGYMSPEQAAGRVRDIDHLCDVYALGANLFKTLTGQPPHDQTGEVFQVIHRIVSQAPRMPRLLNPRIPVALERLLLMAVASDKEERYPSAAALADDLQAFLDDQPLSFERTNSRRRFKLPLPWRRRRRKVAS